MTYTLCSKTEIHQYTSAWVDEHFVSRLQMIFESVSQCESKKAVKYQDF